MTEKEILIAFGGVSPEHEVSVLTAIQAAEALKETEYKPAALYITKTGRWLTGDELLKLENYQDLKSLEQKAIPCTFSVGESGQTELVEMQRRGLFGSPVRHPVYAVLTAFHGADGENGAFQGTFETFNLPYTGSPVLGAAVGMDKSVAKDLCRQYEIPVTPDITFHESGWTEKSADILKKIDSMGYPVFVKPVRLGSSIGVKRADNRDETVEAVETAFRYDRRVMVEKAVIPLTEINCSVLGNENKAVASVCEQPRGKDELLTFEDKYLSGDAAKGMASADRIIPAPISEDLTRIIQQNAVTIFQKLGASGVARLDFLLNSETGEWFFNEINTIPGSFSFYLWDKSGYEFPALLKKIIEIAIERHKERNGRIRSYETNLLSKKSVEGIKGLAFRK